MNGTPSAPERIPPVDSQVDRPFWSVMIPTYNRATYLERTLASVLAQDPGPQKMQIEVVDDASTSDDPGPPNGGAVFHDTAVWLGSA